MTENFFSLTPDRVLDSIELAMGSATTGIRATGRVQALNSLENRVYDIELEDGRSVVAKFYRPGRWKPEQIIEEHAFTRRLKEVEIPVVAPLDLVHSEKSRIYADTRFNLKTIAQNQDEIFFAVFPKVRGRIVDELDKTRLQMLGRYIARIHNVGEFFPIKHRLRLDVETFGVNALAFLKETRLVDDQIKARYLFLAEDIIKTLSARLQNMKTMAIHGDCHLGNTLWGIDGPFVLDFDDLCAGPAVQDVWMIIRGRDEQAINDRETLIQAYEEMRPFDRSTLQLIEPLRALRLIHYSAWIAKRWDDPIFQFTFPHFPTQKYWQSEVEALGEIHAMMHS